MQVNGLDAIPSELWPILIIVAVIQIAVQIVALVSLVRRPAEYVRGPKWAWALGIILLSNMALGSILYFVVGRLPQQPYPDIDKLPMAPSANEKSSQDAVDVLYGGKGDE